MSCHQLYGRIVCAPVALPAPRAPSENADVTIISSSDSLRPPHITLSGNRFTYSTLSDGCVYVAWFDHYEFIVSANGDCIVAHNIADAEEDALYTYLLSHALSIALLKNGLEGLHAACIAYSSGAIAFVGDGGFGKSTLAAFAIKRGARLLTDDLMVCDTPATPVVLPGAARIKLEREHGTAILGDRSAVPITDAGGKWIFPLRDDEFAATPAPLAAILVLQPHAAAPVLKRLPPSDAFRSLLAATFDPLATDPQRLHRHMEHAHALVASTPVFSLAVPRDVERINEVLDLVGSTLQQ